MRPFPVTPGRVYPWERGQCIVAPMIDAVHDPPAAARWWRLVGWSFLVGGVIDLAFGLTILFAAEAAAPLLRLTLPDPRVYLDLDGLFLAALGAFYLLIFREPRRLAPIAAAAALLRAAGCALMLGDALTGRAETAFLWIALMDGLLAVVHLVLLHRAAGSLLRAFAPERIAAISPRPAAEE